MMTTEATIETPRIHAGRAYRDQRAADLSASAAEAFAKHRIVTQSTDRWRIAIPYDAAGMQDNPMPRWQSQYAAEIIVLWHGSILVHGDIDTIIWTRYSDDTNPRNVLRWMGARHATVDGYCLQKAEAGTGREMVTRHDSDAFRTDLTDLFADEKQMDVENGENPGAGERSRAVRDAIDDFDRYETDPQTIRRDLYDAGLDVESFSHLGIVTAARVYYAHAALRRLCALLEIT